MALGHDRTGRLPAAAKADGRGPQATREGVTRAGAARVHQFLSAVDHRQAPGERDCGRIQLTRPPGARGSRCQTSRATADSRSQPRTISARRLAPDALPRGTGTSSVRQPPRRAAGAVRSEALAPQRAPQSGVARSRVRRARSRAASQRQAHHSRTGTGRRPAGFASRVGSRRRLDARARPGDHIPRRFHDDRLPTATRLGVRSDHLGLSNPSCTSVSGSTAGRARR